MAVFGEAGGEFVGAGGVLGVVARRGKRNVVVRLGEQAGNGGNGVRRHFLTEQLIAGGRIAWRGKFLSPDAQRCQDMSPDPNGAKLSGFWDGRAGLLLWKSARS